MAVLRITNFGGLRPRMHARALPADAAQTAHNLQATTREFRPLSQDSTVVANTGGASNPKTLFRLQRKADGSLNTDFTNAATWRIHAQDISYAKYQVNSDTTDRHCYTYNDGSQPPRVLDATGNDRQLGVPPPATKPTVSVNVVDEFTSTDRAAGIQQAAQEAFNAVYANLTAAWVGADHPGTGTPGYLDQLTTYGFPTTDESRMLRAYRLSGAGGTVSDDYTSLEASRFSWIFDPQLQGGPGATNGTPAWAGTAGTPHWLLGFRAYGQTYTLNTSALSTALAAIAMPGTSDGTKFLTGPQVTSVVNALNSYFDPANAVLKGRIDALKAKVAEVKGLLDGSAASSLVAQVQAFYSKTDVSDEITDAIANFAENIWAAADAVARASLPGDYYSGSGESSGP